MINRVLTWLKLWDRYRTIFILLVLDTLQAEIQFLYFFYLKIWETRNAFLLDHLNTIKTSDKHGFDQYPSYNVIQYYFIVVGALITRMIVNWLLFDGISTGIRSHVRAGVIGSICSTSYIVIGGIIFWVEQYKYFQLPWRYLTLTIVGFVLYGIITGGILYILWHDEHRGSLRSYSKHFSASLLLVCGVFVGFVQLQLILWFVAVVWYSPRDEKFHPQTHRFPV